jgi:hypothetical protein
MRPAALSKLARLLLVLDLEQSAFNGRGAAEAP